MFISIRIITLARTSAAAQKLMLIFPQVPRA